MTSLGNELSHLLDKDMQLLWQLLLDDSETSDAGQKSRALAVWIWVCVHACVCVHIDL